MKNAILREKDLAVIVLISLVSIPIVYLTHGELRIVIGLPLLLFIPGYSLLAALFPREESITLIERIALSFGMSIAVVPLIGLILNYTPLGIRLTPVFMFILLFIFVTCGIGWYRRNELSEPERYKLTINLQRFSLKGQSRVDKFLSILLAVAIVSTVVVLAFVVVKPKIGERFTEFYILSSEETADNYPGELKLGEKGEIIVGVINDELEPMDYRIELRLDGKSDILSSWIIEEKIIREDEKENPGDLPTETVIREDYWTEGGKEMVGNAVDIKQLEYKDKWEGRLLFEPLEMGTDKRLEFLLFYPKLRQGHALSALLEDDGFARIEVNEADGMAEVSLDNKSTMAREYRLEVLQQGIVNENYSFTVAPGQILEDEITFAAAESIFLLYEDDVLVIDDSGAELALHIWLDVGWD